MATRDSLTATQLQNIIHYDRTTGVFTWLKLPKKAWVKPGSIAGYIGNYGYRLIKIGQFKYQAHRLAWLYVTGKWPTDEVDHKDRVRSNNSWNNLRAATHKENHENLGVHKQSVSGMRGVTWDKDRQQWLVRIKHNGHMKNLGRYNNLQNAMTARTNAERAHFTHSEACSPLGENPE